MLKNNTGYCTFKNPKNREIPPPSEFFLFYQILPDLIIANEHMKFWPSHGVGELVDPFLSLPGCILKSNRVRDGPSESFFSNRVESLSLQSFSF